MVTLHVLPFAPAAARILPRAGLEPDLKRKKLLSGRAVTPHRLVLTRVTENSPARGLGAGPGHLRIMWCTRWDQALGVIEDERAKSPVDLASAGKAEPA